MLVLSRRENEKILFPSLGISVEVLRIRGSIAKIGVDAPEDVPIQRAEIAGLKSISFSTETDARTELFHLRNEARTRLDAAATGLNRLHQIAEENELTSAQEEIMNVFRELRQLDREFGDRGSAKAQTEKVKRALLVEDNKNESELMASFLRMYGFEVITSPDGIDALNYLSMHSAPDLVLLDMKMPRCDGATFVNEIRANPALKDLKLFALSGMEPQQAGVKVGPEGVNRWFHKPVVNPESFIDEVTRELSETSAA